MTVDAATNRRDVPPPIDLAGHFRDLGRMFVPALIIGALIGGAVFAYLSTQVEKQYSASVVTQVTTQGEIVAGDAFVEQLRAPFQQLAVDDGVLAQVLTQVDTGWDTSTLRDHVTLTPGTAPSLLIFGATADDPRTAQQVARAMVAAVAQANEANAARDVSRRVDQIDASIAFEQARNGRLANGSDARTQSDGRLAELRAQRDQVAGAGGNQLTVLSVPVASSSPVSPKPLSTALVAGVIGVIVAAELLVLARGRLGRRNNRIWVRRMATRHQARQLVVGREPFDASKLLYGELAHRHRRGRAAVILTGESVETVEVVLPGAATDGGSHRVERGALSDDWWRDVDLGDLVVAVVVISARGRDRAATADCLSQLADLGATRYLVLQTRRGGRTRRGTKETSRDE